MNNNGKYDDIINLPHHVSKKHPQMSLEARSAQFAPFSALTGFDDVIVETERLTDDKKEVNEEQKEILDNKIQIIKERIYEKPKIKVCYFKPDSRKDGGAYVTITGIVKKIDEYKRLLIFEDNIEVPISEILEIRGDIF